MLDLAAPDTDDVIRERFTKRRAELDRSIAQLERDTVVLAERVSYEEAKRYPMFTGEWRRDLAATLARLPMERALLHALDAAEARAIAENAPIREQYRLQKIEIDKLHCTRVQRELDVATYELQKRPPGAWSHNRAAWQTLESASRDDVIDPRLRKQAAEMVAEGLAAAAAEARHAYPHLFREPLTKTQET